MAVLIASSLDKDVSGTPLLRGVSLKLERRDRLTIAGRNGSGKTTLLRMLAGQTSIDGGEVVLEKGARVALHDQRPPRQRDLSLRDYVLEGCADLVALEATLTRLEHAMADGATDAATLAQYSRAQARLEHAGGYDWRERAMWVVRGLGFRDDDLDRPLHSFSGGELTRGSLARALAGDPDLLLLDEPTNHLDIASLEWLEQQLTTMDTAVALVAHDRWFLESVGTAVLELEAGRSRYFSGTWASWRKESAARDLALGRAVERQQAEIERLERFATRFRAGTRARQAQSRVKKLNKIERIEPRARDGRDTGFSFGSAERSGRVVLEMEKGKLSVGERTLLEEAELWLERGEHVTLVGPNGSGKTTLLEALVGRRPLDGGKLRRGHNARVGYLSQHAEELGEQGTVLDAAQRATGLTPNKARGLLGRFLFSGDEAEKRLSDLSGGERRRLSLAVLVHSQPNVLVIDEPTNHLDVESREALEDSLRSFDGSLLLVSHDRALLDAVGTRTIAVEERGLKSYEGGWAEYVRAREERKAEGRATKTNGGAGKENGGAAKKNGAAGKANGAASRAASPPGLSKNGVRRAAALEREIAGAEGALAAIEDELADPGAWADPERSSRSTKRHAEAKRAVERLYEQLEAVGG